MTDIEILASAIQILRREQKKVRLNHARFGMLEGAIEMLYETRQRLQDIISHG